MFHKPYLVHLGLGSLLESVQNNLQVFLELSTDGESDVSKCRQDLGLHRPVHVLILHRQRQAVKDMHTNTKLNWINLELTIDYSKLS